MKREYRLEDNLIISGLGLVYIPDEETVGISDMHLGFEMYLESEGVHLPRIQMKIEEERINAILQDYSPSTLLINGDVKHEFSRNTPQEWLEIRRLFSLLTGRCRVVIVRGNHDNYILNIAERYGIRVVKSISIGNCMFSHGDMLIPPRNGRTTVIGHEHPSIRIVDEVSASVKFPAFVYFRRDPLLILPAFSPFALGTDVISDWWSLHSPYLRERESGEAVIYAVVNSKLRMLGKLSDVRSAHSNATVEREED
jgi:putative SbcD/Mre11-related phosphoesterase